MKKKTREQAKPYGKRRLLFEEFTIFFELLSRKANLQIENQKQTTGGHEKNIVKNTNFTSSQKQLASKKSKLSRVQMDSPEDI